MSDLPASDPHKKLPDHEKRPIKIPAWWSIVALIMAGLVVLPIQYANMHTKNNVPAEAEAKPNATETASPAKDEAKPEETQATRTAEPAEAPNATKTASPAQDDAKPAETQVTRAAEPAEIQPKPTVDELASPTKEEAKPAETQVTQTAEPAEAQPKPSAAEVASSAKEEAKPAETEVTRAAEQAKAQPKASAAETAPQAKDEAKSVVTEATRAAEPAAAQPKPNTAETASARAPQAKAEATPPAKQESAAAKAPAKPLVADAGSQAKQDVAQPKPDLKQPVALPKSPAEKQKVENAVVFRIDGKDKEGRAAAFDFVVLSSDYVWALGSTSQVVSGGKVIREADAANRIFAPKVRDALAGVSDVIGVGLASKDGIRSEEEARALARSKTVATWITKVAKPETALWALTLGQYDKGCKRQEDKDSSFERPVLFVGVRSKADGANLQEALANALSGHNNLPNRECYSRFDMEKIR